MNNQSSPADHPDTPETLASVFGPELYPVTAGFQHIISRNPRIDLESTAILLNLMQKGDLTMLKAEADESAEGLAYLTKASLISVSKGDGGSAVVLTETGRTLAAEVMDLFEPKASPLQ